MAGKSRGKTRKQEIYDELLKADSWQERDRLMLEMNREYRKTDSKLFTPEEIRLYGLDSLDRKKKRAR